MQTAVHTDEAVGRSTSDDTPVRDRTLWGRARFECQPERFDALIEQFWAEARRALAALPDRAPDGSWRFERGASRVDGLIDRTRRFASIRVDRIEPGKNPRLFTTEAFAVIPASGMLRAGASVWRCELDGRPLPGGQKEPVLIGRLRDALGTPIPASRCPDHETLLGLARDAVLAPTGREAADSQSRPVEQPVTGQSEAMHGSRGEGEDALDEAIAIEIERDAQADTIRRLTARVNALTAALGQSRTSEADVSAGARIWTLDELPEWAADNEHRIHLLPRAYAGAKRSVYKDESVIFDALEFLAGPYRQMRTGEIDVRAFERALAACGLRLAGSVGATVAGEQGAAYFVSWHGKRTFMDLHLSKGGGFDRRYCIRLYFFWDDESGMPVVGWLPSHLPNSLS